MVQCKLEDNTRYIKLYENCYIENNVICTLKIHIVGNRKDKGNT